MWKHTVTKLLLVIRHVPDQYKTQEKCNKVFLENGRKLMSVPDCYKNKKSVIKLLIAMPLS